MAPYRDLHAYVAELERQNKLIRIRSKINKDTELMPMVRLQFRGLPEEERKAFLFENVTDSNGRRYEMPVLVGALAASRDIYCIGMQCEASRLLEKWMDAQRRPIPPRLVNEGTVHDVVLRGDDLLVEGNGLDRFPIPISTPGFDCAPYTTMSHWVTKDLETGQRNLGNYRGHLKARNRLGVYIYPTQDIAHHWRTCRQHSKPLQAALILGCPPHISYTAVAKLPGLDELSVAGALAGEPVELVPCKTVDLEVPAWAEIVVEGEINTDYLEPEAPFGEFAGFIGERLLNPFFEVTCITHRKDAIYGAIISQFPPSESSKIRQMASEPLLYKRLKYDANIQSVTDVAFHESGGSWHYIVIQLSKPNPGEPMQALHKAIAFEQVAKIFIAVDETVDLRDPDAVNWAMCYYMQPHRDTVTVRFRSGFLDHSGSPQGETDIFPLPAGNSSLLIDATRKWPYPPISLPRKDLMEHAMRLWDREGLPPLKLKAPWHGYDLGKWNNELEEEAEMAMKGEYFKTGEKLARQRVKVE